MKFLVLLAAVSAVSAGGIPDKMAERVMEMSVIADCWGQENMKNFMGMVKGKADECLGMEQTITEADLFEQMPRGARGALPRLPGSGSRNAAATHNMDPEKMAMKMEKMEMLRAEKALKISNLTCVLKGTGMWNDDESVNMEFFRNVFNDPDTIDNFSDEYKTMSVAKYESCYALSQALPVENYPNPGMRRFSKQMLFMKCVLKADLDVCLLKKMADMMEMKYEKEFDPEMAMMLGLPPRKMEAAYMSMMMAPHMMPPAKRFVLEMINHGESDPYAA